MNFNDSDLCYSYAQLDNLIAQLIQFYPTCLLYVFLPGLSPRYVTSYFYQLFQTPGTSYGGFFVLDNFGAHVAVPLNAIIAMQFDLAVYNPAITYLPTPQFSAGCDTNIITSIHDYLSSDMSVELDMGTITYSTGPIYINEYGLVV